MTECFLRPEAVRPLNISPQCHAFPSRITAPSLHNCRLPPGCTMSKHVVLTVGGGGCVSCPEHGDGQQELGEQAWWRPLLLGQSGCCCVTETPYIPVWTLPPLPHSPRGPPAGEGRMGGETGCLPRGVRERPHPHPDQDGSSSVWAAVTARVSHIRAT